MAKKKKEVEISEEEMVHEAEAQGLLEHDEAEQILAEDKVQEQGGRGFQGAADESDVKRPELKGERAKPKFEQPGTNNQSRIVHDDSDPDKAS